MPYWHIFPLQISRNYVYNLGIRWLFFNDFFHEMDWNASTRVCWFSIVITIIIWPLRSSFDRYDRLPHGHWGSYDNQSLAVTTSSPLISQSKYELLWYTCLSKLSNQMALLSIQLRHQKRICQPHIFWHNRRLFITPVLARLHLGWS